MFSNNNVKCFDTITEDIYQHNFSVSLNRDMIQKPTIETKRTPEYKKIQTRNLEVDPLGWKSRN